MLIDHIDYFWHLWYNLYI